MRTCTAIIISAILLTTFASGETNSIFGEVKGMEFYGPTTFTHVFDPGGSFVLRQFCTTDVGSVLSGVMVWKNAFLDTGAKIKSVQEYHVESDSLRKFKIMVQGKEVARLDSLLSAMHNCPSMTLSVCGKSIKFYERQSSWGAEVRQIWIRSEEEGVLECWALKDPLQ